MLYANQQNRQALNDTLNQMWAERQKAQKDRVKTLQSMQDSIAKIASEIHKHRAKTAIDINKGMRRLVAGTLILLDGLPGCGSGRNSLRKANRSPLLRGAERSGAPGVWRAGATAHPAVTAGRRYWDRNPDRGRSPFW